MATIRSICVYCGSSPGKDGAYLNAARTLGKAMGGAGMRLVYGGGARGIMGAIAEATAEAGGSVMGIIPRFLMNKEASEAALARLDNVVVTEDMHARKHRMFEESDAFVALPGGIGTLEEIVEIMTWAQLGRHRKPMVFGNVGGFWNPMMALMEHMKREGFLHSAHLVQPLLVDDPADILPAVLGSEPCHRDREGQDAIIDRL
jgi:uncharacterized protein (TIGR00730 family)